MNKFLETYKINTKHLIQNNVLEFIDIFQEDKSNEVKKVYRSRLIKEIKTSTYHHLLLLMKNQKLLKKL